MTEDNRPSWQYVPPTSPTESNTVDATKYMKGGAPRRSANATEQVNTQQQANDTLQTQSAASTEQTQMNENNSTDNAVMENQETQEAQSYQNNNEERTERSYSDRPRRDGRRGRGGRRYENRDGRRENRGENRQSENRSSENRPQNRENNRNGRNNRRGNRNKGFFGGLVSAIKKFFRGFKSNSPEKILPNGERYFRTDNYLAKMKSGENNKNND